MKTMKKVLAMLVSMVMVLAFCVTGVAADVELTQHTFAAYQIFKGDLTEGNKLSNVTWGWRSGGETLNRIEKASSVCNVCERSRCCQGSGNI